MTPKIHMLCLILINSVPLNLFYVFGCSFRMLAVILVSDLFFIYFFPCNTFESLQNFWNSEEPFASLKKKHGHGLTVSK